MWEAVISLLADDDAVIEESDFFEVADELFFLTEDIGHADVVTFPLDKDRVFHYELVTVVITEVDIRFTQSDPPAILLDSVLQL
jgi:hypothetical protein